MPQRKCLCLKGEVSKESWRGGVGELCQWEECYIKWCYDKCWRVELENYYVKSVDMLEEYYVMGRLLLLECFCLSIRVCLSMLEDFYVMGRLLWECCVFV